MARESRSVGFVFGILGALLVALEGLVDIVRGIAYAAIGRALLGLDVLSQALVFIVLGLVLGFFVAMGRWGGRDRVLAAGVVLIVLSLLGLLVLGFEAGVLALIGGIFTLIAGLLYTLDAR